MKSLIGKILGLATLLTLAASSAFAYGGAVAIVFNPQTGVYGSYHGGSSRYDAEANALAECGNNCYGTDVNSLENRLTNVRETWALNGWVALAKGNNGVFGTSGMHDSEYDAEQSALNNCGGAANGCYVVRSTSSFANYPDVDGVRNN